MKLHATMSRARGSANIDLDADKISSLNPYSAARAHTRTTGICRREEKCPFTAKHKGSSQQSHVRTAGEAPKQRANKLRVHKCANFLRAPNEQLCVAVVGRRILCKHRSVDYNNNNK